MATVQDALMHVCSVASRAIDSWIVANDEASIQGSVIKELETQKKKIVLQLLGFNDKWGKYEVDHCNGRAGESSAGDYLKRVSAPAIDKFLASVEMPELTQTERKSLQRSYRHHLYHEVEQHLRHQATRDARELSEKLIKEALPAANPVEKYTELLKLIKG